MTLSARTVSNADQRTTVDKSLSLVTSFFLHQHLNLRNSQFCSLSLTNDRFALLTRRVAVERAQMISGTGERWRGFFSPTFANVKQWMHVFINNRM